MKGRKLQGKTKQERFENKMTSEGGKQREKNDLALIRDPKKYYYCNTNYAQSKLCTI